MRASKCSQPFRTGREENREFSLRSWIGHALLVTWKAENLQHYSMHRDARKKAIGFKFVTGIFLRSN
ncbi:hypothetical protein AB6A40_008661 [Gnathostoma spinigerum]|uniref:Uncharacterized protein n=1 Tax=Gnathostoma spinigerum TaxID=75299 RepID=A0ABD6EZ86_9BILA